MKPREIRGEKPWKFEGKDTNPHAFEHVDLISPIRSGKPPYECRQIAV